MAEYATVSAENLIKIDPKIPLDCAALVGCGVTTGVGAVFNTAKVEPGSSVAVFGCGGVGLSVIQGARHRRRATHHRDRYAGAQAGDGEEVRRHRYDPGDQGRRRRPKTLKKLTGGGPDYAFECVGSGELAATAYRAIRRGGLAVVVGVAKPSDSTAIRTMTLPFEEKTITGSYFGSCVPRVDFPRMLALYMAGRLKLEELITRRYPIAEAPQAFADLQAGKNARGVIVF